MSELKVVTINKTAAAALKWVLAASYSNRVYVANGELVATCGRSLHIARPNIEMPLPDGFWAVLSNAKNLVVLESCIEAPPNYREVLEIAYKIKLKPHLVDESYRVEYSIATKALKAALQVGATSFKFTLRGGPVMLEAVLQDEYNLTALIMPLHKEVKKGEPEPKAVQLLPDLWEE